MKFSLGTVLILSMLTASCGSDDDTSSRGSYVPPANNNGEEPSGPGTSVGGTCLDGEYTEVLPNPDADIDGLIANYSPINDVGFLLDTLGVRYPVGEYVVSEALLDQSIGHCVEMFLHDSSTATKVMRRSSTVVHECGHILDWAKSSFSTDAYVIRSDLRFDCAEGDTTDRGGKTFARSLIRNDAFSSGHPPCNGGGGSGCDYYADIYLDGDPFDSSFDSGDQGYNTVLEEFLQYTNSLAVDFAFHQETISSGASVGARDGLLTFMWYVARYLHLARNSYPNAYDHIVHNTCWREATLTVWGRALLFLHATEEIGNLGISDNKLAQLLQDPILQEEIDKLRIAQGC